ncbi:hypothetical protein Q7C36_022049 [Tachysurus vachellii]|uniref:Fibronectin type-III domain-containing protein n=1 Tax=Tachysurus vachellii TaxID=175792 RepID=A0AA88ISG8_TACVA|nr:hypothetical protein Q7C36_022049 [Tachysurus vachellii]
MTPSNDSEADVEEWTVIDRTPSNAQNTFTLTGLKPTEQHWVQYRAVSDVGVSEASDSVPFTFQGKLTVTVDQWNWSESTFGKELKTGISRTKRSDIQCDVPHPVCNPVMVNGLEYCKFKHLIPVDKVTTLNISGDVFMNTFGITKVDDINLKVTNPANI